MVPPPVVAAPAVVPPAPAVVVAAVGVGGVAPRELVGVEGHAHGGDGEALGAVQHLKGFGFMVWVWVGDFSCRVYGWRSAPQHNHNHAHTCW